MSTDTTHTRQDALTDRFLRYSAVSSQSDASTTTVPSSEGQRDLAHLLAAELEAMGAADVHVSDTAVLTARIPATADAGHAPAVGFCAHLDTADVSLSPHVNARVIEYSGGDVELNDEEAIRLDEHPELERYVGDRLLVTDGTSVLGADDKAAIAVLMEMADGLLAGAARPHGEVYLAFVPDEEIGLRGVRTLDLDRFPVRIAYTIDSCEVGELVAETFNAAQAQVTITGVSAHPMSAKGVLVNPILVAHDVVARLDRARTPEQTEGREGFVWVTGISGSQSEASLTINIRDHDRGRFEEAKADLQRAVEEVARLHPRAGVELQIADVYANIAGTLTPENRGAVDLLHAVMSDLGITPIPLAMRGGTDGSWLSTQGILTPNFFTGAHNFHSPAEFLPLSSFERSHAVAVELVHRLAEGAGA